MNQFLDNFLTHRLLVAVSSKNNNHYLQLKEALKDSKVREQLESRNIHINESTIEDKNIFKLYLYDYNMSPLFLTTTFDHDTINQILNITDRYTIKKTQAGGHHSYKQKYYKYKSRYNKMKKIITKFY
jgi:hypothetical protein